MSAAPLRLVSPPPLAEAASDRRPIRRLDPLLINQIAAGEVIERPASIVKELVENALDAGAARITVELDQGGLTRISVIDDGRGIPPAELPLALAPHATSKVHEAADLDRIATMGFRGEALASIASIARVSLLSRVPGSDEAWSIRAEGGPPDEAVPAAAPAGTRIDVRDLFFNTPARRKFLRSEATERTRCQEWLRDLAMAHPAVGFTLRCDGKDTLSLPGQQLPRDRVLALLGRELAGQVVDVTVDGFDDNRGVLIWGLAGLPAIARPTNKAQHVFLNGRAIRDKTVQHALREAYRGLIDPGRHPTAVLMLEMSPAAVDVNVHPAKLEVRFRDPSAVHQSVLHGVRRALQAADLTRPVTTPASGWLPAPQFGPHAVDRSAQAFVERVRSMREDAERAVRPVPSVADLRAALADTPPPAISAAAAPRRAERFLQVHNSYIIVEDEAGLLLIDQHALHERVMFQTFLERLGLDGSGLDGSGPARSLESQTLLTPIPVPCEPAQLDRLEEIGGLLLRIGVDAVALGPRTLGVRAFPSLLLSRGVEPGGFVLELLARADAEGFAPGSEAALHEVLDMMACKAAVKAGERLSDAEISTLLEQRHQVSRSSACPHGRPTSVRLGLTQLERLFERR